MSLSKGIFELDFLFFILLLVAMVSATGNLRKLDIIYTFKGPQEGSVPLNGNTVVPSQTVNIRCPGESIIVFLVLAFRAFFLLKSINRQKSDLRDKSPGLKTVAI